MRDCKVKAIPKHAGIVTSSSNVGTLVLHSVWHYHKRPLT